MFKKILLLVFLLFFIIAPEAHGIIIMPYFNITVVENTVGGDTVSNFNFVDYYSGYYDKTFQIQTQDGTGTYTINATTGNGGVFELTQEDSSAWDVSVQCTSDNPQVLFTQINNGVDITGYPFSSVTCTFTNTKKIEKNPVILIPGILGSWEVGGKWEIDPILNTYDNLWEALKLAGYEEGKNLFAFPYNWRYSNTYTAQLLKDKISEIKNICNCSKVDVVAHSMGGLVARAYVEGLDYQNDIDQLIFIATPHKGAPKDYLSWEGGEMGVGKDDDVTERLLIAEALFNGYGFSLYNYVRNFPIKSVEELLPIYDYLKDKETGLIRVYPDNYPQNIFLEQLNNLTELAKLGSVNVLNIIGEVGDSSTINILRVVNKNFSDGKWANGYPENYDLPSGDQGLEKGSGDGTVPLVSNENFGMGREVIIGNTEHRKIVTDAQGEIIKELTGKYPNTIVNEKSPVRLLMIRIFSPADFVITAPDGSRLGKDFILNQSVNEIDGAFYSGFDNGPEFAVIPDPQEGEYKVDLLGTGSGEYKLSASYIDDNIAIDNDVQNVINLNQPEQISFNYIIPIDNSTPPISQVDLQKTVTIDDIIQDVQTVYNSGGFSKARIKNQAIKTLEDFKNDLQKIADRINVLKKMEEKIANSKLKDKTKEKLTSIIESRIEKNTIKSDKTLQKQLTSLKEKLNKYYKQGMITKDGYDILIQDINYLLAN